MSESCLAKLMAVKVGQGTEGLAHGTHLKDMDVFFFLGEKKLAGSFRFRTTMGSVLATDLKSTSL